MKISLHDIKQHADIDYLIIESVDLSLYIARAQIGDEQHVLAESDGRIIKTHNLLSLQRRLKKVYSGEIRLQQRSAYDEMIGHQHSSSDNTLEISLGREPLPPWLN